jgi:hypothetical protein
MLPDSKSVERRARPAFTGAVLVLLAVLLAPTGAGAVCSKKQHSDLSDAHHNAKLIAERFYEEIDHLAAINKASATRQAAAVAKALQQVREAEQACTQAGPPSGRSAAWNYRQMLNHQQTAFDDLDQLQKELASEAPRLNHVISLTVDISRHMEMAEEAHQDSMT